MASRMISFSSAKDSSLDSATSLKVLLSAPMPVVLLNVIAACHLTMRLLLQGSQFSNSQQSLLDFVCSTGLPLVGPKLSVMLRLLQGFSDARQYDIGKHIVGAVRPPVRFPSSAFQGAAKLLVGRFVGQFAPSL